MALRSRRDPLWIESTLLVRSRSSGELLVRLPADSVAYDIRLNGRRIRPNANTDGRLLVYLAENDRLHEVGMRWRWNPVGTFDAQGDREIKFPHLVDFDGPAVWTVLVPPGSSVSSERIANTCPALAGYRGKGFGETVGIPQRAAASIRRRRTHSFLAIWRIQL